MIDAHPTPLISSRLGLLAAYALIVILTVAAIAPQQWPIVASMAVTEGVPLIAWLLAAYGFGSVALRDGEDVLTQITRIAVGLGAMSLLTLLLGVLGILHQWSAVLIVVTGCATAVRRIYNDRNTTSAWLRAPPGAAWLLILAAPVFGIVLIGTCVLPGVLWGLDDPSGYDVVAYHLQMPREWYELGRVTTLDHNVFSFFPLNVEMHSLLAMHLRGGPWAGMYLAQMMHGAFVALTVAAVYGAARTHGRLAASVAAIVCAGVPWMAMLGSVAYVEGGLMLYATLAMAWSLRGRWMLAGACAGFACGCKLTGVPLAALIGAVAGSLSLWERVRVRAVEASNDDGGPRAISSPVRPHPSPLPEGEGAVTRRFDAVRHLLVFAATALLVFSPWLIRTAIAAHGNPIFPLAMRTLGAAHFDVGQVERFEAAHAPRVDQQSIAARIDALWWQVGRDYHFGTGQIAGVPLTAWLPVVLLISIIAWRSREAYAWFGVIAGSIVIWIFATHLQGRFLVQVIPFFAVMTSCVSRPMVRSRRALVAEPRSTASGIPVLDYGPEDKSSSTERLFTLMILGCVLASAALTMPIIVKKLTAATPAIGLDSDALTSLMPKPVAAAVRESTGQIILVGDAKTFWYAIPSTRLRYRSVFDVPSTKSFRDAWLGDAADDALVIVDTSELARFEKTYRNLPPKPAALRERDVFVIRAADVPR